MGRSIHGRRKWDYTKHEWIARPREKVVFPLEIMEYGECGELYSITSNSKWREDRKFAPYQKGECFYFFDGGIKIARVLSVHLEPYKDRDDGSILYYYPRYRVQTMTKDLHWSNSYTYVFPGYIYRAYYVKEGDKKAYTRSLPTFMLAEWVPLLSNKLTEHEKGRL